MNTIIRSPGRTVVMTLVFASLIGSLASISPVFADNDKGNRQKARHSQNQSRDDHERRGYRPVYRHPYAEPVYVPAPVYYEPRQSPGISLFFPLDFRR